MESPGQIRKMVKRDAAVAIHANLKPTLGLTALYGALTAPFGYFLLVQGKITGLMGLLIFLLELLLLSPFILGLRMWCLQIVRGQRPPVSLAFSYYRRERYSTSLILVGYFKMIGYLLGIFLAYMMLVIVIMLTCYFRVFSGQLLSPMYRWQGAFPLELDRLGRGELLLIIISVVSMAVCALLLLWGIRTFLARYLCAYNFYLDDEHLPLSIAFERSRSVMRGRTGEMAAFYLSFLPWLLLVPFTAGLLLVWLVPYINTAELLYVEYFRDRAMQSRAE